MICDPPPPPGPAHAQRYCTVQQRRGCQWACVSVNADATRLADSARTQFTKCLYCQCSGHAYSSRKPSSPSQKEKFIDSPNSMVSKSTPVVVYCHRAAHRADVLRLGNESASCSSESLTRALLASPLETYEPERFPPSSSFFSMAANYHTRHSCQSTY